MYLVSVIIMNFKEDIKGHFQNCDCQDLKVPELELELKSLELELELKLFVSSGIGIGIENNGIGIGIELKKWNWPQPCPGPLKIQWGPCEILPESPMDPQNGRVGNVFNGRTLQILLGALRNSNCGGPGPSTKNVYWEPCVYSLKLLTGKCH